MIRSQNSFKRVLRAASAAMIGVSALIGVAGTAAAADIPAGVSTKLVEGSNGLSKLWASETARMPVIVQFAVPAVPDEASFASPDEADKATIAAVHAVQDRILANLLGGAAGAQAAQADADRALKRMDFSPVFAMNVSAGELEKLAANPEVVAIQQDVADPPDLIQSLPLIGMPVAWSAGATGAGFHVAVLDTGARRTHEFLSSRVVSAACYSTTNGGSQSTSICPGGASSSVDINSALDCDNTTIAGCGHGTHTSGTAAGFNTNLQAGEPSNGVARDGRLITINVFSRFASSQCNGNFGSNGCVLAFVSDQIRGLDRVFALRNTFAIASINMSLGGGQFSSFCNSDTRKPIIDSLRAANIATVIAAGNDGFNGSVGAPGCISTAMTVASTTKSDVRSGFSNWATLVDVAAPGSSIQASYLNGNTPTYAFLSGTSMATPHVAGAWAAIRSKLPNATATQIETALQNTGLSITSAGVTLPRIRVSNALGSLGVNVTPPANDNFANAINVASVPFSTGGSNVNSTVENGEPNAGVQNGGTTVWWRFTAPVAGTFVVSTEGSNFDTVATIYTGGSVDNLTQVGNDDDGGTGATSRATFTAVAGTTYRIRIRGFAGAQGSIGLQVFGPTPSNDNFANSILIPSFGTVTGSNVGASFEADEPVSRGNSVWWRFQPTASGPIRINTFGSNFDTVLQVTTGTSVSALTVIGTNDDTASLQSELVVNAVAGTSYNISVRGFSLAQGNIVLSVSSGGTGNALILSAISPVARATAINTQVTAFATMINAGTAVATGCRPGLPGGTSNVAFSFQSRASNGQLGTTNGPMNIAAGGRQDFLMRFTATAAQSTNLAMVFTCTNTNPAPSTPGLNTFLLTATAPPAPADVIATTATVSGDGIMNIPLNGTGFTGIAAMNIGSAANLQLRLGSSPPIGAANPALPVTITVCQTNPNTAACLAPPQAPPLNFTAGAGATVTFSAFLRSNGTAIPFDPANKRLFANFFQGSTAVGSTSVAVRTTAPDPKASNVTASAD